MAEGGGTDDQSKSRRVRLMCPHPPRPFQPYCGPPVAEGEMITSFSVAGAQDIDASPNWRRNNQPIISRVDCGFDPYSEEKITASVDLQVLQSTSLFSFNDEPLITTFQLSVRARQQIDIPYGRSNKSVSTAFCSDGNRLAWSDDTSFGVFDRFENTTETVPEVYGTLWGTFSPDGCHLAVLTSFEDLIYLEVFYSNTFEKVADGCCFAENIQPCRPEGTYLEDNPLHLLWSKCGKFLGLSTYYRELILFKVEAMIESETSRETRCVLPKFPHHDDFSDISHPQAYDFATRTFGASQGERVTVLAVGTIHNCIRLYDVSKSKAELISLTDVRENVLLDNHADVINCVRFSNAQDLLAVALSSGSIALLDSVFLLPIKRLQRAEFGMQNQPEAMPFYRGFSSLSFSCSDNFLAAGATDGLVRVWCVRRPVGPLLALCRTVIRSCCKLEDMNQLSVPSFIRSFLTKIAF